MQPLLASKPRKFNNPVNRDINQVSGNWRHLRWDETLSELLSANKKLRKISMANIISEFNNPNRRFSIYNIFLKISFTTQRKQADV